MFKVFFLVIPTHNENITQTQIKLMKKQKNNLTSVETVKSVQQNNGNAMPTGKS